MTSWKAHASFSVSDCETNISRNHSYNTGTWVGRLIK